jgi:hypothetical protein
VSEAVDPNVAWLRKELEVILGGFAETVREQVRGGLQGAATAAATSVEEIAYRYHLGSAISMNDDGSAFTLALWLEPRKDGPGELLNPDHE